MRKVVGSVTTSVVPDGQPPSTGWRLMGLIVCITTLCVVGLFWETVRSMVDVWASSRTFAHGFLVLPATGYLVWCYRYMWMQLVPAPSAWGVAALILLGSGWFVGYVTDVMWLQQAAVVAMLPGLVWAILGKEIVKTLSWPLGFLVFMLPVGTSIEPWLQDFTAWFIQVGLQLTNIPYLYEENYRDCTFLGHMVSGPRLRRLTLSAPWVGAWICLRDTDLPAAGLVVLSFSLSVPWC